MNELFDDYESPLAEKLLKIREKMKKGELCSREEAESRAEKFFKDHDLDKYKINEDYMVFTPKDVVYSLHGKAGKDAPYVRYADFVDDSNAPRSGRNGGASVLSTGDPAYAIFTCNDSLVDDFNQKFKCLENNRMWVPFYNAGPEVCFENDVMQDRFVKVIKNGGKSLKPNATIDDKSHIEVACRAWKMMYDFKR